MQLIKRIPFLLLALALMALSAACASAPTAEAPTAVPPSPTPLALPTSAPVVAAAPTTGSSSPDAAAGTELSGATVYQMSCASCHGEDRKGHTFEMDGQKIDVPSLAWDDLNSTFSANPSRGSVSDQIAIAITKGQDETGADLNAMMPRWSSLSQSQVDTLVQFLQTAGTANVASGDGGPAASGLMGQQLYEASCAACHGTDGAGKDFEKDGNKISTPSLHWGELSQTYAADPSRGSVSDQVALSITKGQDEKGGDLNAMMPRWSTLSQAQVDSLVQYLQTNFK